MCSRLIVRQVRPVPGTEKPSRLEAQWFATSRAISSLRRDSPRFAQYEREHRLTTTTPDTDATALEDRLAILELIGRLALTIDGRDRDTLGQLFTDTVYHDRISLTGGEPMTLEVAEFVDGWRQTLQNMDAVHHQITNHVISLDGDQATCEANMQGIHVLANASGGPMWTVGGRHDYQLTRTPGGWRIAGLTFTLQWASGNMNVLTLAMAGGQS